ncbi:hypothetical protein GW950_00570 [Candidatus Wolfebacteria bacterium]|nr:hypothetical protein [Candidatus Wolfebacteria bacterium]
MIINWYGEGCFKIQTSGLTIVTDPFDSKIGLNPPRGSFDITLKTLTPWPLQEEEFSVVIGSGEYEIKGISIKGFPLQKESSENFIKTVYRVEAENISLGFLGHLSDQLPADALEILNDVNVLFVPAAGKPFIDQTKLTKLLKQIKPRIVVGSFFKVPKLKRTTEDFKKLVNETGLKLEQLEKLSIRKKEVTDQKGTKFVVLKL